MGWQNGHVHELQRSGPATIFFPSMVIPEKAPTQFGHLVSFGSSKIETSLRFEKLLMFSNVPKRAVITSYSIHYTKLYDMPILPAHFDKEALQTNTSRFHWSGCCSPLWSKIFDSYVCRPGRKAADSR